MTSTPDCRNGAGAGPNLVTTADGLTQYAAWYTQRGSGLSVGKRTRSSSTWTVHALAGAEVTEMGLPVPNDVDSVGHRFCSLGYDSSGYVHLFANMHNDGTANTQKVRYLKTNSPGDITSWTAPTLPSEDVSCAYPQPVQMTNGDLYLFMRCGPNGAGSAVGNTLDWRIKNGETAWKDGAGTTTANGRLFWQGVLVANGGGPGVTGDGYGSDTTANWSAYCALPFIEPAWSLHPSRVWMYGNRKVTQDGLGTADLLTVMYSDDHGVTWKAVDGSAVTLPVDFINNGTNAQTGLSAPSGNWAHSDISLMCVNPTTGWPLVIMPVTSGGNLYKLQYNGTSWSSPQETSTWWNQVGTGRLATHAFYRKDKTLWFRFTSGNHPRKQYLVQDATTNLVMMSHELEPPGAAGWQMGDGNAPLHWISSYDPVAYRKLGALEWLVPDDDIPKVYSFGSHARMRGV